MIYCKQDIVQKCNRREYAQCQRKKKFTVYVGSVALCVGAAILLHYVSFTNPYLQSILSPFKAFLFI